MSQLANVPEVPATLAAIAPPQVGELIDFPTGKYAIPPADMADFLNLAESERERIKFLLTLFAQMEKGGVVKMSKVLGFQLRHSRGYKEHNLRAFYYRWKAGGWTAVKRDYNNGKESLPAEFIQYWRALSENNGRSMKQAMGKLKRSWMNGEEIPGFGTWQQWYFSKWPLKEQPAVCPSFRSRGRLAAIYALAVTRAEMEKTAAAAKKVAEEEGKNIEAAKRSRQEAATALQINQLNGQAFENSNLAENDKLSVSESDARKEAKKKDDAALAAVPADVAAKGLAKIKNPLAGGDLNADQEEAVLKRALEINKNALAQEGRQAGETIGEAVALALRETFPQLTNEIARSIRSSIDGEVKAATAALQGKIDAVSRR